MEGGVKKRKKKQKFWSFKGCRNGKKIVKSSIKLKIPYSTFYVFSSENWKRPKKEIYYLFKLIENYFSKEIDQVTSQGIKINILGEINKFSNNLKKYLKELLN